MKKIVGAVVLTFTLPIVAFVIFIYYVLYTWEMENQGEFRDYDKGVTIEVNNLSNQDLSNLIFSYSASYEVFEEVGTIKSLKAGESAQITGSSKEIKSSDTSLYLHYYIDNGGKAEESLAYYKTREPSKAVVVLTIHEVEPIGFLKFEFSGYDGWSRYGPIKVNYE
ncbi:MAG: hypothetical protein ABS939_13945 [Psychrobacillus sp.]